MKGKFYISLRLKFAATLMLLLAAIMSTVYYYFSQEMESEEFNRLFEKSNSINQFTSNETARLLFKNPTVLEARIDSLINNEKIEYLVISHQDSIHYDYNKHSADSNNYLINNKDSISLKDKMLKINSKIHFEDNNVGNISIGYSLTEFNNRIYEIRESTVKVCLIIFFIAAILLFIIVLVFTGPLNKLVKVVEKMIEGDLSQRIQIKSRDEFSFFADVFNETVVKLATSDAEMQTIKRELEKRVKDRTGELEGALRSLQSENKQRKKAEVEISSSLHEKEVLLKEIHHRVKNNLQIVSSLFFFQSKQITDPATLEMFRDGQNRVKSMALIHEKLYQSGDLAHIDFKEYIKKLTNFLLQSYGVNQVKVKLKINVQRVELDVDTAVPCGLIINELISNSLKHAFTDKDNGEIRIDMGYDENNKLILKISDNGKGIPTEFKIENSDSLGLRLVSNLTTQLNGEVRFFNNNGTSVKIIFPNPKKAS